MEENKVFKRNCPICNIEITYCNNAKLKRSIKNNSNCQSCCKKGKNNPMFNKKGENHHNYGIKRPDMIGENNPAKNIDVRKKISDALKLIPTEKRPMFGKHHIIESKNKSSISNTGKIRTVETVEKIRQATLKQIENGLHSNNIFCKKKIYLETDLHYQGTYELHFLNKYFDKIKIENGKNFYYIFNDKKKIYISDFYLPEYNLIVEIKSSYTFNLDLEKNLAKYNSMKNINNSFNFLVIKDKIYDEFDLILKGRY